MPKVLADTNAPRLRRRPPEPWESELLRLLAEQGAIPFDQFARFLGADPSQAARVARHLTKAGYADYGRFLHGEPHWLWLTSRGARHSGLGFAGLPPRVGAMARARAVNEIRLHITARAPEARWVSGRTVFREQGRTGFRPNAVVELEGERHAILVQLRSRPADLLNEMLVSHMRRYDAVVLFCSPRMARGSKRLSKDRDWAKLVVRAIPQPPKSS
jgi:hypothetical protein